MGEPGKVGPESRRSSVACERVDGKAFHDAAAFQVDYIRYICRWVRCCVGSDAGGRKWPWSRRRSGSLIAQQTADSFRPGSLSAACSLPSTLGTSAVISFADERTRMCLPFSRLLGDKTSQEYFVSLDVKALLSETSTTRPYLSRSDRAMILKSLQTLEAQVETKTISKLEDQIGLLVNESRSESVVDSVVPPEIWSQYALLHDQCSEMASNVAGKLLMALRSEDLIRGCALSIFERDPSLQWMERGLFCRISERGEISFLRYLAGSDSDSGHLKITTYNATSVADAVAYLVKVLPPHDEWLSEMALYNAAWDLLPSLQNDSIPKEHRLFPFVPKLRSLLPLTLPRVMARALQLLNQLPTDLLASVSIGASSDGLVVSFRSRQMFCHILDHNVVTTDDTAERPDAVLYACALSMASTDFVPEYFLRVVDAVRRLTEASVNK